MPLGLDNDDQYDNTADQVHQREYLCLDEQKRKLDRELIAGDTHSMSCHPVLSYPKGPVD